MLHFDDRERIAQMAFEFGSKAISDALEKNPNLSKLQKLQIRAAAERSFCNELDRKIEQDREHEENSFSLGRDFF